MNVLKGRDGIVFKGRHGDGMKDINSGHAMIRYEYKVDRQTCSLNSFRKLVDHRIGILYSGPGTN